MSSLPSLYVEAPIEIDLTVLLERTYDYMRANVAGWQPSPGQLDVWLLQAIVMATAELRQTAGDVPPSIFQYFGPLAGIYPTQATNATARVKFTAIDNAGYTIPASTQIGVYTDPVTYLPFVTVADAIIPAGQTFVDNVQITAVIPGAASSDLGDINIPAVLLDPKDFIDSVILDGPTSGGQDAEDVQTYISRLSALLMTLTPRPILPRDFAILARYYPGVGRATALDGYNPDNLTYNNERYVTVPVADIDGNMVDPSTKTGLQAYLDEMREVNFIVRVIDPTYTTVQVNYQVKALSGQDTVAVKASVDAALAGYLDPSTWGLPQESSEPTVRYNNPAGWANQTTVRYSKVTSVIDRTSGVDYIESLTIGLPPAAQGTLDLALPGPAPLPTLAILGAVD